MSTLNSLMTRATSGIDTTPTADVLDGDVQRGRQARRRRTARAGGLGATAVLALAVAVALPLGTTPSASAVPLVAYAGDQPDGFVLDVVPEGWRVLASNPGELVLAPAGDDGADPASYDGRIAVSLLGEGSLPSDLATAPEFTVDGVDVRVYPMLGGHGPGETSDGPDGTHGVFVPQGGGDYLYAQVPPEVHWTAQAAADFAATITVTDDVQGSVG